MSVLPPAGLFRLSGSLFYLLFGLLLLAAPACKKDKDDPAPVTPPSTGSLTGTISPPGSITTVTATSASGETFHATPDPTTGVFTIPNLPVGTYTVSFTPASGFAAPPSQTITINARATASMGSVAAHYPSGTIRGTMTWKANGVSYTTDRITGSIVGNGQIINVAGVIINGPHLDEMNVQITHHGPGSYLVSDGDAGFDYLRFSSNVFVSRHRARYQGGGAGNAYIVSYSNTGVPITITGTFGFTGVSLDANGYSDQRPALTVTDGTFNLSVY
ncbi:MAG TPA: carboxypeptidase-like regulatory domain-containing protein [bacterium]|nr:carboxypeptidase-like regulatory domain-containing protein [bacterium]